MKQVFYTVAIIAVVCLVLFIIAMRAISAAYPVGG